MQGEGPDPRKPPGEAPAANRDRDVNRVLGGGSELSSNCGCTCPNRSIFDSQLLEIPKRYWQVKMASLVHEETEFQVYGYIFNFSYL